MVDGLLRADARHRAPKPKQPVDAFDVKGAEFDPERKYRFRLSREWDHRKPVVLFIMLNPSTADENVLDPTLTRCRKYAEAWGFGKMMVGNLWALRSTDPKALLTHPDPVGFGNIGHLVTMHEASALTVVGWGANVKHPTLSQHAASVLQMLREVKPVYALRITKEGHPQHPLYLPGDLKPFRWEA